MINDFTKQPWASGPAEILNHGMELLAVEDSDKNRRIAIISIDNSVELMIKTFLNLPKRITGLRINRKEYTEFSESFPRLLDALEKYAESKLDGVNLGEIEWYHRLRNELYHQGNGLTVERRKVEVYGELAKILFKNLYGIDLIPNDPANQDPLGIFMNLWVELERNLHFLILKRGKKPYPRGLIDEVQIQFKNGCLSTKDLHNFDFLRKTRNQLVHGEIDIENTITTDLLELLNSLVIKISSLNK